MHIRIPAHSVKGSDVVPLGEGTILFVPDRWVEDLPHTPMHTIFVGDVEIHCNGFTISVERNGGFMTLDAAAVTEDSFDRFLAQHPDGWHDGTGRVKFEPVDPGAPLGAVRKTVVWPPGCAPRRPRLADRARPIQS